MVKIKNVKLILSKLKINIFKNIIPFYPLDRSEILDTLATTPLKKYLILLFSRLKKQSTVKNYKDEDNKIWGTSKDNSKRRIWIF